MYSNYTNPQEKKTRTSAYVFLNLPKKGATSPRSIPESIGIEENSLICYDPSE